MEDNTTTTWPGQHNKQHVHVLMRVGIIGAGLSGLMCAQRLSELAPSLQVSVLEWGRGPGGRTARRRVTLDSGTELSHHIKNASVWPLPYKIY